MADIKDVRDYWNNNPLLSHELSAPGSPEFFESLDYAKQTDSDRFSIDYWEFSTHPNEMVLDVGCGPGWLTVNYARGGSQVTSIDITPRAVELTKRHLDYKDLEAEVFVANAEYLPFEDEKFDFVASSGVLHHTPDTYKTFSECFRVLRTNGRAKITLYRKGILHSPWVFGLTKMAMRLTQLKHPGADMANNSHDVDDFVRQYDGAGNPIGIAMKDVEWVSMLVKAGFQVNGYRIHFFPKRFLPFGAYIPKFIHFLLDRYLGTMIYLDLHKPPR